MSARRLARAFSSASGVAPAALEYLSKLGYSPSMAMTMLKTISPTAAVSTRELDRFGEQGLAQLAKAVQREMDEQVAQATKPAVTVHVRAPASGHSFTLKATEGQNFYELAQSAPLRDYLECACKGIAACSTCHVILDPTQAALFPPPDEAELDMLDLSAGVTDTSRLGCQLVLSAKHEGLRIEIPKTFTNLY